MAARLNRMHSDQVRAKIKIGNIIDRLEKHVAGEIELTPAQVTSARILLDKTMSNAPQETVITGDKDRPVYVQLSDDELIREIQLLRESNAQIIGR